MKAAVVIANPFDLAVVSAALQSTWIGREIYSATMAKGMKKLFEQSVTSPLIECFRDFSTR